VAVWYAIAAIVFGAKPMSERVSRTAFLLYILFLQLASAHHLLADPGLSTEWKVFNTSYAMYLAVLASMVHGLTVPGSIEVAQREKGYTRGLFEWIRKAPWGNPVFSGMFISLVGFGFLGGISGVMMGTEQLNMLIHNTIYVPGHFHATVVIGTTLAFMALTYFLIPTLFQREMIAPGLAKWQPYLFGLGMAVFVLAMMGAGTLGVPRRHWDITFAGTAVHHRGIAALGQASRRRRLRHAGQRAAHAGRDRDHRARACGLRRAGNLRVRAGVPDRICAVLLRQLEVPIHGLGAGLRDGARGDGECLSR
jgi:cytochrome c oxidase subunit 1